MHSPRTGSFRTVAFCTVTLLVALQGARSAQTIPASPGAPTERGDLVDLFAPGVLLEDTNGDGVIDKVNAHLALGPDPSASDVSAGADIAARLGYETSAMDIPLTSAAHSVPIAIGAGGVKAAGISIALPPLGPGEGLIESVAGNGSRAVVVTGGDDPGTRAAAEWIAGRFPHVWNPTGTTLGTVVADVRGFLSGASVGVSSIRVPRVRVKTAGEGIERLELSVSLTSAADATRAEAALRRLIGPLASANKKTATPPDEKRALSYAGVRMLRIEFADAATIKPIDLPGVTPSVPGPMPGRPGSAAKDGLSVANLYANDGLLGDSDNNLIPDRVDVHPVSFGIGHGGHSRRRCTPRPRIDRHRRADCDPGKRAEESGVATDPHAHRDSPSIGRPARDGREIHASRAPGGRRARAGRA